MDVGNDISRRPLDSWEAKHEDAAGVHDASCSIDLEAMRSGVSMIRVPQLQCAGLWLRLTNVDANEWNAATPESLPKQGISAYARREYDIILSALALSQI
jgi:hypothetical protein